MLALGRGSGGMAITRRSQAYAIAGLGVAGLACFAFVKPIAAAAAAESPTYSVSIQWEDDRHPERYNGGMMEADVSIGANTTEITDMFANLEWIDQNFPKEGPRKVVVDDNRSNCISYTISEAQHAGDFKLCGKVSIDGASSRTIDVVSEWNKKQPPIYRLKVSAKFTLQVTSDGCKVKLVSGSRNYQGESGEAIPFARIVKEECKRD